MPPLTLVVGRRPTGGPPAYGAPGPLDIALSLLVHRALPFRPASIDIARSWLGLHDPAVVGSTTAVAARRGVSRQRIQTALSQLRAVAAEITPPPALLEAAALLAGGPPARSTADGTQGLLEAGMTGVPLHPATVLAAARLFQLHAGFALRGPAPGAALITAAHLTAYDTAPRRLQVIARRRGLISLDDLAGEQPHAVVELALEDAPGVAGHDGWYWTIPDHSPLPRLVSRMLTVCGPLPPGELIAGLHRATRHSPTTTRRIPTETLQAYLASQQAPATSAAVRLTTTDRALAAAYTTHATGELPTSVLVGALTAAGLASRSAHTLVSLSPLLHQVRPGVQQLRSGEQEPMLSSEPLPRE